MDAREPGLIYAESIVDTIREGLIVLDEDLRVVSANRFFYQQFRVTPDETIGRLIYELGNHQWDIPKLRFLLEAIIPEQSAIDDFEVRHRFEDIGEKVMHLIARRLIREEGKPGLILLAMEDITERVRTEAVLKRAQEIAHLGSWELDLVENRLTWSDEIYRIFGLSPQEFGATYEAFLDHVHPDDRESVNAAYTGSVQENRDGYEIDHRVVRHATGEVRFVHEKCYHIRDTDGKIIRSTGMVHDITERKRAEDELLRRSKELEIANSDLESFSYSVSHDLRSPLTTIQGFSNILLEDYSERLGEQGKAFLGHITSATQKMSSIIDNLMSLARISQEKMNCREIDLGPIAQSVVSDLRQAQQERTVLVTIEEPLPAFADARFMNITLSNLIGNAWKYTGNKSVALINIGIVRKENENVYFIQDNGVGFDMSFADKIFEPFQRLHSDSQFTGTGIGLAIVNRIIQRHGGRIWAESESSRGSTFYFTLNCH